MKYQSRPYKCGPATVRNVFRAFGLKVSEDVLTNLCETTPDGTDEIGIINAVRAYGFTATEFQSKDKKAGWQWLHGCLLHGKAVILCIDAWEHWVACVGSLGDRVVIVDPANFKYNKAENGIHIWSKQHLMKKWWNARKSVEGEDRLYAIAVGKK